MATFDILPPYNFPPDSGIGLVSRETLGDQNSIAETQLPVCALNEPLRYGYGLNRVGALLLQPVIYGANLLLPFIIGRGPIQSVDKIEFESTAAPPTVGQTIYLGAATQAIDPWLQAAWAQASPPRVYADRLNGISWGILSFPPIAGLTLTGLTVEAKMLKVYDPRLDSTQPGGSGSQRLADSSTWTYSANPVLALVDFLKSTAYGRGETLNWPSVMTCANVGDQVPSGGTGTRRSIGLMIDSYRDVQDVEETLRAYAGVWIVREGGVVYLVPDAPAATAFTFTNASGSGNYVANSLRIAQRARRDSPTVVTVRWTDTSVKPWRETPWTEPAGGLAAGVPWREQVVSMPGIQDAGYAKRECLRRLNDYITADLTVNLTGMGEAAQLRIGDVVAVTDSEGLSAKQFRLVGHRPAEPGLWAETLAEYDAAVYSDAVATGPGAGDTVLPQPNNPPAVTGVGAIGEVYPTGVGVYSSRWVVTWTAPSWPQSFIQNFIVEVLKSGAIVHSGTAAPGSTSYTTPALPEVDAAGSLINYTINVSIFSVVQVKGAAGTFSGQLSGKLAIPSDVVSLDAFEVNGEVRATIDPAKDVDMTSHEYRYGANYGGATDDSSIASQWTASTLIDRVAYPSRTMVTKALAAGSWRLFVKGRDSVRSLTLPYGQESAKAKWKDIVVTSDANAFVAASGTFTDASPSAPLLSKMALRPPGVWVTDIADTWNSLFPNAMNTYGNSIWQYHSSGTATLMTGYADVGALVTGDWSVALNYYAINGSAVVQMELCAGADSGLTISAATTATPSVLTKTSHGYSVGDEVVGSGFAGTGDVATKLNVRAWIGTVPNANDFTLVDFAGTAIGITGTYTANSGSTSRWQWAQYISLRTKASARFVRARLASAGTDTVEIFNPIGSYQVNVIAKPMGGFFTGSNSAPVFVRFPFPVTKLVSLATAASGATGGSAKYDKVEVSGGRAIQSLSNVLRFVGTSTQYVTCPSIAANQLTTTWAVEAWVKVAVGAAAQVVVRKCTTAAGAQYAWGLTVRTNNCLRGVAIINGTTFNVDTPYVIADGAWHHCAATLSGGTLSLYVDGLLVGTTATSGTWVAPTSPVGIGAQPPENGSGVWASPLDGVIQEVRIWNVARTQSELQALMNSAAVGNESGLVALYHLNGTSGTSATDSTSNANTGTLTGSTGTPSWRPLDGFDGYVFNGSGAQINGDASWNATGV